MAEKKRENFKTARVIVNADDFGLNSRNSRAIAEAFRKGLITDTTMIANGGFFEEAVKLAETEGFIDKIGVHLNLTEGVPLTEDIKKFPVFVTGGRFNGAVRTQRNRLKRLGKAEKAAVKKELDAQIEKIQNTGIKTTHADSHHHIHTGIFIAPVAAECCKNRGINKIRLHRNLGRISAVKRFVKKKYNIWLGKQGFVTTKFFAYVMDIDGGVIPDNTEIMVHPDYDKNGVLVDRRGMENGLPKGNPVIDLRNEKNIVLRGFADL